MKNSIMSQNKCECPKVPKPLPPNMSSKMRCAQYIKTFGTFEPYNRNKTANISCSRGRTNSRFPVKNIEKNSCGEPI